MTGFSGSASMASCQRRNGIKNGWNPILKLPESCVRSARIPDSWRPCPIMSISGLCYIIKCTIIRAWLIPVFLTIRNIQDVFCTWCISVLAGVTESDTRMHSVYSQVSNLFWNEYTASGPQNLVAWIASLSWKETITVRDKRCRVTDTKHWMLFET